MKKAIEVALSHKYDTKLLVVLANKIYPELVSLTDENGSPFVFKGDSIKGRRIIWGILGGILQHINAK